ncbi:PAS domain-containing protein [Mitsuaria sp. WAJ17]|uniref:ATP-binding protein n=1 Tax=Mitsuaria sp. WAJ17 TaxID=2761452 RepID=UPI00160095F5|nr:ATP-binding protein [Mitsuaria sp. WAJ17]MBB2487141.1 PAS domain-containing protein [Mitsuaria sp. WAJ17]
MSDTLTTPTPPPGRTADLLLVGLALGLGLAASVWAYQALAEEEQLHALKQAQAMAEPVRLEVELTLSRVVEASRSAGLLVSTHRPMRLAAFQHFARELSSSLPPRTLIEWQPQVTGPAQRRQVEREARAEGLVGFEIREPRPDGRGWQPAPEREHYVPVLYGWPAGQSPLGYNLAPDPVRMASKLAAAAQRRPVASNSFAVIHDDITGRRSWGFAITAPVFDPTPEGGTPALRGYLAAVVELPQLLGPAVERARQGGMALWALEGRDEQAPVRFTSLSSASGSTLPPSDRGPAHALQQRFGVDIAGQPWTLLLQPLPEFLDDSQRTRPLAGLLAGMAGTLLISATLWRALAERRRTALAHLQLAQERERLQHVIDGTQAATWEHNLFSGETHVNERWQTLLGYAVGEFQPGPGYDWKDDCHPEDLPRVREALRRHLRGDTPAFDVEYRHRRKPGDWRWIHSRGQVIRRDDQGRAQLIAGTMVDIADRKAAEARVLELNATLEARVVERGEALAEAMESLRESREALAQAQQRATLDALVTGVAHELSSPMSNALVCSESLRTEALQFQARIAQGNLRRTELDSFLQHSAEHAELISRNVRRAVDLIGDVRQVAADQVSAQRRSFDLSQMVGELIGSLSPTLRLQLHQVVLDIPEGIQMDSYPGPLGQVLINLVNNALLHAFEEGQPGEVRIQAEVAGELVQCRVSDNGRGMDQATLEQLFKPFFSTRLNAGGMGLGMLIVDRMVHKVLGGRMQVHSQPGAGTVFTLSLPRVAPPLKPEEPAPGL